MAQRQGKPVSEVVERERYAITPLSKVRIAADKTGIRIEPTQDIIDLAGTLVPKNAKPVLKAREELEQIYRRP